MLDDVRSFAHPGQIVGEIHLPARQARHGRWPGWVSEPVSKALIQRGLDQPWLHQVIAANALHANQHTVLATGTGSGKSLAAWVPVLSALSREDHANRLTSLQRRPTCLYLCPTKALAADQYSSLVDLARAVDPSIGVATVDGDTDSSLRRWARNYGDIVLTNPDFVNYSILTHHKNWTRLFRGLTTIILDEFHSYKGLFGAHVALLTRRILRVARAYGATPRLCFLSATTSDPSGTAARFLGIDPTEITLVNDDSSPCGERDILLWQCREIEEDGTQDFLPAFLPSDDPPRRSANTEAGELTGFLADRGARNLTFVRSRQGSESVAQIARTWLKEHAPAKVNQVAAYRGGYLPEERRELEAELRSGNLLALATTNALELGIDISGLDSVVLTGWPGTHASFAQQFGRAGRAGRRGLSIFVGRDNPLDRYYLSHPDLLSETTAETHVFDPSNPTVLLSHVCAAAAELPLTEPDAAVFGLDSTELFASLTEQGFLRARQAGWYWNIALGKNPHALVDLRGEGASMTIVDAQEGAVLGTVSAAQADSSVHPGAIYVHQGHLFRVERWEDEELVWVHAHEGADIRTFARSQIHIEIEAERESLNFGDLTWSFGDVAVSSSVDSYDIRRTSDWMFLGNIPLSMPVRTLHTRAAWWTLPHSTIRELRIEQDAIAGALHGAEHAMIAMLPLLATCDRWDVGGLSLATHPNTGLPTVFVHDGAEGGAGFSEQGFAQGAAWVKATYEMVSSCPCSRGCPRCIQSPKCGNNNEPLSKSGAAALLGHLARHMSA